MGEVDALAAAAAVAAPLCLPGAAIHFVLCNPWIPQPPEILRYEEYNAQHGAKLAGVEGEEDEEW